MKSTHIVLHKLYVCILTLVVLKVQGNNMAEDVRIQKRSDFDSEEAHHSENPRLLFSLKKKQKELKINTFLKSQNFNKILYMYFYRHKTNVIKYVRKNKLLISYLFYYFVCKNWLKLWEIWFNLLNLTNANICLFIKYLSIYLNTK